MAKILVSMKSLDEQDAARLKAAAPEAEFVFMEERTATKEQVAEADIILGYEPPELVMYNKKLQWLQLSHAGCEEFNHPGILPENCVVTNATGSYGAAIAEHVLALLFCVAKRFPTYFDDQRDHRWGKTGPVGSVFGSKVLVVGMGDIGSECAKRLHALGAEVKAIRAHKTLPPEYISEMGVLEDLDNMLAWADTVVICLPGTEQTRNLFDAERLKKMKQGAYLINIGRGYIVDGDALAEELKNGHLAGAGLDVVNPEPLPADSPLWDAPNCIITPHVSGQNYVRVTRERMIRLFEYNLKAYFAGERMKSVVDMSTGYRRFEE